MLGFFTDEDVLAGEGVVGSESREEGRDRGSGNEGRGLPDSGGTEDGGGSGCGSERRGLDASGSEGRDL